MATTTPISCPRGQLRGSCSCASPAKGPSWQPLERPLSSSRRSRLASLPAARAGRNSPRSPCAAPSADRGGAGSEGDEPAVATLSPKPRREPHRSSVGTGKLWEEGAARAAPASAGSPSARGRRVTDGSGCGHAELRWARSLRGKGCAVSPVSPPAAGSRGTFSPSMELW